ncbi:MAG: NitT/TauT family transport system permease protein [Clostridiales bacterium]|nr:NitT/TauT family transport system permease protein [Clostridiales bacterium]
MSSALTKKSVNINEKIYPAAIILLIVVVWQLLSSSGIIPQFMLPSPINVLRAFYNNFGDLMFHARITLTEAAAGLGLSIALALILATAMDHFDWLYRAFFPLMVISQTIPTVAIAPLLVLWMGYGMMPKVALIVLVCFFPIAVALLDSFRSSDPDLINLMRAMGAKPVQIFRHVKWPAAITGFFSGLKIAVSYAIVGAVISEWLGGNEGLGVYMIRVKRSYAFDKMFAVILLIMIISLILIQVTVWLERITTPWRNLKLEDSINEK